MTVFGCRKCGAVVTAEVTEVPMPDNPLAELDDRGRAAPRMLPGTYTVDPAPFGPPHVPSPDKRPVLVSAGPQGTIILNPDDVRGLRQHSDRNRLNGCCRLDGLDGPNLVCADCGNEIATEQSDCWVSWHEVRLEPAAVVRSAGPA